MSRTVHVTARITPELAEDLLRDAEAAGLPRSEHIFNILEAATAHDPVHPDKIKSE